ncbi:MAG: flagellin FliC [Deltaproteobacteria bacterium]|nr:flagellin FliC [Deltaproteobacteria bacterium]
MALIIQTNVASLQSQKNLNRTQAALSSSFNKLSSGFRINTAADDAAGLAISESMKSQIRSYSVAERNANDAISMAQTAEGSLGEVTDILGRMRQLAMQGANGSLGVDDRSYLATEFSQLQSEVKRIQNSTKFNGTALVTAATASVKFQVGLSNVANDQVTVVFGGVKLTSLLSTGTKVSGATAGNSQAALGTIDAALKTVSTARAKFGAAMNRLDITTQTLQTTRLNLSAANSRIRDVDVAEETATMSRNQVLAQAGAAVLAQANQSPQLAINLLR